MTRCRVLTRVGWIRCFYKTKKTYVTTRKAVSVNVCVNVYVCVLSRSDYWSESDQDEVDGSMTLKQEGPSSICDTYHRTPSVRAKHLNDLQCFFRLMMSFIHSTIHSFIDDSTDSIIVANNITVLFKSSHDNKVQCRVYLRVCL